MPPIKLKMKNMAKIGLAAAIVGVAVWGTDADINNTMGPLDYLSHFVDNLRGGPSLGDTFKLAWYRLEYLGALSKIGLGTSFGGLAAMMYSPFKKKEQESQQ